MQCPWEPVLLSAQALDVRPQAGVSKPGQRSRVEGPVTQVFAGSNPVPRTSDFSDIDFSIRLPLFLNEYPAACCGWDGQETDLRKTAYLHLDD